MLKFRAMKCCSLVTFALLMLLSDLPLLMLEYLLDKVEDVFDTVGPVHLPLSYCAKEPTDSEIEVDFQNRNWSFIESENFDLQLGGRWKPTNCLSKDRTAIIVPYRNRKEHLNILLHHLHPFLQRQNLDYGIYIVEQDPKLEFNRGILLNVGFLVATATYNYNCHVFHDVDHLPVNDNNGYGCPEHVRHMAVAVEKFNYKLVLLLRKFCGLLLSVWQAVFQRELYGAYVGGVLAMKTDDFQAVNGYSNNYFGWGGEDDDFFYRLQSAGLWIERPAPEIGKYRTVQHSQAQKAKDRLKYLRISQKLQKYDGLNSIQVSDVRIVKFPLYTWVYVVVKKSLIRNQTKERVEQEYELWKQREFMKKQEEERQNKLRGNFKKMPPRMPPVGSNFADIPLQKYESK